jgi:hypothetical protein
MGSLARKKYLFTFVASLKQMIETLIEYENGEKIEKRKNVIEKRFSCLKIIIFAF